MRGLVQSLLAIPLWKIVLGLSVIVGIVGILANYPDYLPPNFRADFLLGREDHFYGVYQWAFYAHLVSGPVTLFLGMLLISERFRRRWPGVHRMLGRVQVATVLLLLCPSGLVMSRWAISGQVAAVGFTALTLLTGCTVTLGWRAAVRRQFEVHRRWMLRLFALLMSAIVLRLIAGATNLLQLEGTYPLAAWLSWIVPLVVVEVTTRAASRRQPSSPRP